MLGALCKMFSSKIKPYCLRVLSADVLVSDPKIVLVNEEKPTLFYTEFVVDEGGTLVVDLPRLFAEDGDVPEDELVFTITEPPVNGRFLRVVSSKSVLEKCDCWIHNTSRI